MTILKFTKDLVAHLRQEPIPKGIKTEKEFEQAFVVIVATNIAKNYRDLWLFSHPWGNKECCKPQCRSATKGEGRSVIGCPKCWAESKNWATVEALGTRHNFDLVAKDRSGAVLAIEVKLVKARGGRMPNGEIQRFLGQCAIASAILTSAIGVCGYLGNLNPKYQKDTQALIKWGERNGINLVFRAVDFSTAGKR